MGKILAVCSGSGGVGKSTVAVSLAIGAAKRGLDTILLDASGAARSCDLMLGMESVIVLDMMDVVRQQASIHAALYAAPGRSHLHFACASLYDGAGIGDLSGILLALRALCDVLIVDLPTGPAAFADGLLDEQDALLLLTRPDDASLRATERLLSSLPFAGPERHLIITRQNSLLVKKGVQYSQRNVEVLMDMPVSAVLPEEDSIAIGIKKGKAAIECDLRSRSEIHKLLAQLLEPN